jgi:SAM-dependent methyltransferase
MNDIELLKVRQREDWRHFVPVQMWTTTAAARLVAHARIGSGARVLDVGCGTGVVAVTAARAGARVTGLDLTPQLLDAARDNARLAGVEIDWHEGDVEDMPFADESFDAVVSQFGHMFAPRPEVAVREMLRVLRRGGTVAFTTWPPELLTGRTFAIVGKYGPPPPAGAEPPPLWGNPDVVRQRLGDAVRDLAFDRARMEVPALSPAHYRDMFERTVGPMKRLHDSLQGSDPQKLAAVRREIEAVVAEYFEPNIVRMDYLMTRAIKI